MACETSARVVDVAVIGAGPAGSAAAAALARHGLDVALLDEGRLRGPYRIGESLPAAAGPLLRTLGVWDSFCADRHATCVARTSTWGTAELKVVDALQNPDGAGWLLDRVRFDAMLRRHAEACGAHVDESARVVERSFDGRWWTLDHRSHGPGSTLATLRARAVVDATGRPRRSRSKSAQGLVAPRDPLLCFWSVVAQDRPSPLTTHVESAADGWWYTAPLPSGERVIAFHTDADIARQLRVIEWLPHLALKTSQYFRDQIDGVSWKGPNSVLVNRAGGHRNLPISEQTVPTCVSVGDASMTFDPLSGQGLFHALYTGVAGAAALREQLDTAGGTASADRYDGTMAGAWSTYLARRNAAYLGERRWPEHYFWRRRQTTLLHGTAIPPHAV